MEAELAELEDILLQSGQTWTALPDPVEAMNAALEGNFDLSAKTIITDILHMLGTAMREQALPILGIIAAAFLCAMLFSIADNDSPPWTDSLMLGASVAIALPAGIAFSAAVSAASGFLEELEVINLAVIPLIGSVAVPVKSGVFLITVQILSFLLKHIFLPAAVIYGVLGFCGALHDKFNLRGMASMVKSGYNWGLGIVMLLFTTVTAGAGLVAGTSLSLGIKTIKYTAGSAVPVVGQYLSQTADMVASSASVVKSAAGIGVTIAMLGVCMLPFLKMLAILFLFKAAAVIVRPVTEDKLCSILDMISEAVSMLMGAVALMGVFSIINISVIVGVGVNVV